MEVEKNFPSESRLGHSEDQCYVKNPELYKKQERNKDLKAMELEKAIKDGLNKAIEDPKRKNGVRNKQPVAVWQRRVETQNKFDKLATEVGEVDTTKDPNKHPHKEYNQGTTKQWVKEVYNKQQGQGNEAQTDNQMDGQAKPVDGTDDKANNGPARAPIWVETGRWSLFLTIDPLDGIDEENSIQGVDMYGGNCATSSEDKEGLDMTQVVKIGDLSPRLNSNLKDKRGTPFVPLQMQTSSKGKASTSFQ
ncbi:hypothetical protein H5410_016721 [Solanum commersonii]|uniref:Uncharacterized protein n=1 Tax=Solanum commersonii TaxID=4109 RepID=A0A9J5ZX98_SOLCO|nr:hypothetical protein H5410_016721 [Solanum commersonii]